ncbi:MULTISPECIES: bifunctional 2-polyprenyl-6-hydroxyphenol methylase/3-demethylubiquinol 3-O-methyltransferase UbiG [unclassified Synechocystis]|uniref:class I SAM-dependent methyltransferase n=1 Tax=unclassified Synechocystis TaxID=2640012 RepID=UPI000405960E|nr:MULTISPECIES: class I SAM-dependent methyltransferase [unclassified Synechocystis]AIE74663.1 HlpA protein [Synechocystis sp. PCC 6714]MCT0253981.1 class I SAM-dependent methyltransferase [Synechocystis sp. CS-94]
MDIIEKTDVKCPLCGGYSQHNRHIDRFFLKKEYQTKNDNRDFPPDLSFEDSDEFKCTECELDFSYPMKEGSNLFYKYITNDGSYYANNRWEWTVLLDIFSKQLVSTPLKGLDIGCGNGPFLKKTSQLNEVNFEGIDTNSNAITQACAMGLKASCNSIRTLKETLNNQEKYDIVTSFHTMEHVSDPVVFVREALNLLKPGGRFFFSLPLTPSGLEIFHFTPRNHAPHHLTRWNTKSLNKLAKLLDVSIEFRFPPPQRSKERALYSLAYEYLPRKALFDRRKWNLLPFLHPIKFILYWTTYKKLSKTKQIHDVVLCEIKKP